MIVIVIILPSNIEKAPYLQYYIDIYEANEIEYTVVYWNRNGSNAFDGINSCKYEGIGLRCNEMNSFVKKVVGYFLFVTKVKRIINKETPSKVLIFTIQLGMLLRPYLNKHYKNKYILDIRDYHSIVTHNAEKFKLLVNNACMTVISSEGFKNWLPKGNYVLSHNIRKKLLKKDFGPTELKDRENVILTIGQIRDYELNREISLQISNNIDLKGLYCGFGLTYDLLEAEFSIYNNMSFLGKYRKDDEDKLVLQSDFINAVTPIDSIGKDLTSNRFYLAILYKRPVIVMKGTFQAQLVDRYKIGIVLDDISRLSEKVKNYIEGYNMAIFSKNCERAKSEILSDYRSFEKNVLKVS